MHIPKRMDSGTVITFDKDLNIIVMEKGKDIKLSEEAKKEKEKDDKEFMVNERNYDLPYAKEGMIVVYDALGAPVVMQRHKDKDINVKIKEIKDSTELIDSSINSITSGGSQTGIISWYDGEGDIGAAEVELTSVSAAHRTLEFFTLLNVRSNENSKSTTVYVMDRGPFVSGRILDMVKTAFSRLHDTSKGIFNGTITWY